MVMSSQGAEVFHASDASRSAFIMKFIRHLLGWGLVLGSIIGVVWGSFELRERWGPPEHDEHEEGGKTEHATEKEERGEAHLDAEARKRLGLATAELRAAEWQSQAAAAGEVLNLVPYHDARDELSTAEATAVTAKRAQERAKTLKAAGDIAEKDYDAANSAALESELKVAAIKRRIAAEWGDAVKTPLTASTLLARVELPASVAPSAPASVVRVMIGGNFAKASAVTAFPAPTADPKTQYPAWIIRLEGIASPAAPGTVVGAQLAFGEESKKGVLIPAAAVVHFNGLAWCFVEEKEGEYERRAVALDRAMEGGWFAADGFEAGEKVVSTGAVHLLAVENIGLLGEKD